MLCVSPAPFEDTALVTLLQARRDIQNRSTKTFPPCYLSKFWGACCDENDRDRVPMIGSHVQKKDPLNVHAGWYSHRTSGLG